MKCLLISLISLSILSGTAIAQNQTTTLDGVTLCKTQLEFLQVISQELCRMQPSYLVDGSGNVLYFLHDADKCMEASNNVITKAKECQNIL